MAPGARNKFDAPMFEPAVSRKQMYCFEKSAYVIVVTSWLPVVIRRPGNFAPSLRLSSYSIKLGKFSDNKKFSSLNVMNFYSMNICSFRTQYGMDLAQTANKGYRHFTFLRVVFVSLLCLRHAFFLAWTCACFSNNKTFPKFNKLLF